MAPQDSIPLSASIFGLISTVCWCVQLFPQIWKSYRTKSTKGLPSTMMLLWGISGLPFGAYAILQKFNIPLQVQPQGFGLLCTVSWGQVKHYSGFVGWSARKSVIACGVVLTLLAGLQVMLVLLLREPYDRGKEWAETVVTFIGVFACVIMISGFLPIPPDLIRRRGRVVGFSFIFLAIDWSGAMFALVSLALQHSFDITFGTLYALVAAIEGAMFISHGIFLLRTYPLRQQAWQAGLAFDNYPAAVEWQNKGWDLTFPTLRGILAQWWHRTGVVRSDV